MYVMLSFASHPLGRNMDAHAISSDLMNAMLSRLPERERRSLAEALARGAEAKEALLRWAGGAWTVDEVAAHLGISRQAVNKRRIAGTLLAVEAGDCFLYPRFQFTEDGVLEGLPAVLQAIDTESGWMKLQVLFTYTLRTSPERAGEPPETILEALQRGRTEDAVHAARSWGTQGA